MSARALVLRVVDFGESDRIVHLLTPEHGRLAAIAKGARRSVRRFSGTLDVFNLLRVELAPRRRPGALGRLEQARLEGWFPGLREEPRRFALACYLVELLDRGAPEGGPGTGALFRFAREALGLVETASPNRGLRVLLELRALDALGLRPELAHCVRCGADPFAGSPPAVAFHVPEGGTLCSACAQGVPGVLRVRAGTVRALAQALRLALPRLGRLVLGGAVLAEAGTLVEGLVRFHVGLELRSAGFLDHALGGATPGDRRRPSPAAPAAPPAAPPYPGSPSD